MDVIAVMEMAYSRRHELLQEEDVKGVAMMLNPLGVQLTIARRDGSCDTEHLPRGVEN